jgi:hypothetical protein
MIKKEMLAAGNIIPEPTTKMPTRYGARLHVGVWGFGVLDLDFAFCVFIFCFLTLLHSDA